MKICLVLPYDISLTGGVTNHVVNFAIELQEKGQDVTILTTSSKNNFLIKNVEVFNLGKPVPIKFGSTVANILLSWKSLFKVYNFFKKNKFDIVHIHEPLVPFISIFSTIFSRSKTVLTFHATLKENWKFRAWGLLLKPWVGTKNSIIAISNSARKSLKMYNYDFPSNLHPNGVGNQFFLKSNSIKKDKLKILFVGRNEKRKGAELLIKAYKGLNYKNIKNDYELVMIGKGIEKFKNKYNNLDNCKFFGHLEGKSLLNHYSNSDILCSPAIENESFGIVLIEAMASKTAVLASNINGYNEIINNKNGLLFQNKDVNDLINKLTLLIEDDNLRNNLKNFGYEFSRKYNWKKVSEDILKAYKNL